MQEDEKLKIYYWEKTDWGSTDHNEEGLYPSKEALMDAIVELFKNIS